MLAAVWAAAADFDDFAVDGKAARRHGFRERAFYVGVIQLGDVAAIATDQELTGVVFTGVGAANERVQAGDAMHQSVFHEEIEGAVHRHGRGLSAARIEPRQNVVSADGRVARPHGFQHLLTDVGEARFAGEAHLFRGT